MTPGVPAFSEVGVNGAVTLMLSLLGVLLMDPLRARREFAPDDVESVGVGGVTVVLGAVKSVAIGGREVPALFPFR